MPVVYIQWEIRNVKKDGKYHGMVIHFFRLIYCLYVARRQLKHFVASIKNPKASLVIPFLLLKKGRPPIEIT